MTSKLTRERLQEIAEDGFLKHGESKELARMVLAATDSEPVAEVVSIYGDPEAFGEREIRPLVGIQQMPYGTKFYRHAQPAPVVPEEMTPEMMRAVQLNSELGAYAASNLSGAYDLFAEFWKVACRAAMLIGGKP
ncbi:hypothetical protein E4W41_20060 [Klebsiella pneumoniae]|uniref:hypothetical protein n=1 Tax=Klebsiella pneumoniae TaxID=573 RepID=UPI000C7F1F8A|nr:hypothetical protein [Klebsiella pneumoniae]HDS7130626.1 hypothetical protein [Klebsiella pneumoniae subsp. ozaenae]EKZ9928796.1 hypothetical protein [Klebsiella pneumoniae]MBG2457580.1 hypothetical protein [Klebsiella pneumoniae]MDZ6001473.1 hypothetical protein [Klebsiella pneumoniae]NHX58864.1 hypothetical protein [Klebsiella pneumoniae]